LSESETSVKDPGFETLIEILQLLPGESPDVVSGLESVLEDFLKEEDRVD
jgi:hypothetical protein